MLDQEDLKWIAKISTELNSNLQQVTRYIDLAQQHKGEGNCLERIADGVAAASHAAQALFDRVTAKILEGTARKSSAEARISAGQQMQQTGAMAEPSESPKAKSSAVPADIAVKNPGGTREYILVI